jgi:type IV secretory pathway VirB2 component (pilin)
MLIFAKMIAVITQIFLNFTAVLGTEDFQRIINLLVFSDLGNHPSEI